MTESKSAQQNINSKLLHNKGVLNLRCLMEPKHMPLACACGLFYS